MFSAIGNLIDLNIINENKKEIKKDEQLKNKIKIILGVLGGFATLIYTLIINNKSI